MVKITWFLSFSGKNWRRIIMSFRQNTMFGPETCQIGPKLWLQSCPDLPRPVLLSNFIIFYKIIGFTKRIYHVYKIIGFTKRIYHFYKIIGFTKRIYHFYKIIGFTKRIYKFTSPYRQTTFLLLKFQGLRFLYFYYEFYDFH